MTEDRGRFVRQWKVRRFGWLSWLVVQYDLDVRLKAYGMGLDVIRAVFYRQPGVLTGCCVGSACFGKACKCEGVLRIGLFGRGSTAGLLRVIHGVGLSRLGTILVRDGEVCVQVAGGRLVRCFWAGDCVAQVTQVGYYCFVTRDMVGSVCWKSVRKCLDCGIEMRHVWVQDGVCCRRLLTVGRLKKHIAFGGKDEVFNRILSSSWHAGGLKAC